MRATLSLILVVVLLMAYVPAVPADSPAGVAIRAGEENVDFLIGKELVGRYHKGPEVAKPYFWPLYGPGQSVVTRAWPMEAKQAGGSNDHVHQKSFWFCHGDVIPEGMELKRKIRGVEGVDFWSEAPGHGRIVCTTVGEPKLDKDHGQVTTRNEWRTADGQTVLEETRTIHLYDLAPARLFVFDIDLHAGAAPVTFGDTKEGSFGVRVNDAIREEVQAPKTRKRAKGPGKIENADGKVGERDCWGRVSAWCDYSGPIDGKINGLAIFADPTNAVPSCWHSRGYGLMAANPFGREKSGFPAMKGKSDLVRLAKGQHLKLRYGLLLHPGDVKDGRVAECYEKFVGLK
jgi:hypothetical protein